MVWCLLPLRGMQMLSLKVPNSKGAHRAVLKMSKPLGVPKSKDMFNMIPFWRGARPEIGHG